MHSRAARAARGWFAATFATLVAAFSHTVAGGVPPTLFGVFASLLLSGAACTLLAGRTLSLVRLAASVGVSQALFHGLFSTLGTPTVAEHGHGGVPLGAAATAPHADMAMAHLAAALVTLVALRHGERTFWGIAGTARLLLARLIPVVIPVLPSLPRVAPAPRMLPTRTVLLLSPMRHRGPPRGFAAA